MTELTSRPLPHPGAVTWAVAGGIAFKHDQVVNAYIKAIAAGTGSASQAVAAAIVLASRGAEKRALRTLQRARVQFTEADDLALIDQLIARLSDADSDAGAPDAQISRHRAAITALLKRGDPGGLTALIAEGGLDPGALLGSFEALAARRHWTAINDHRPHLLAFGTARAVEIAAVAAFESGDPQSCLSILQEGRRCFHGEHLPHRLRVIEARAHLKLGRPDLALELAESLRAAGPEESTVALELARLRIGIGDLAGAAEVMRRLRRRQDVPLNDRMQIAWELRREDPQLARSLLSDIAWERLQQRVVPSAFTLALDLGLVDAQMVLFPKFQEAAKSKRSGVMVIESVEEAIAFAERNAVQRQEAAEQLRRQWLAAEIPAHAAFDSDPIAFARLFHEPFQKSPIPDADGAVQGLPLLLRSGHVRDASEEDDGKGASNGAEQTVAEPLSAPPHLLLDISAVLLGQEIGLLDKLDSIASTISISQDLPEALRTIEEAFAERFGPISAAAQAVLMAVDDGRLAITTFPRNGDQPYEPQS